MAKALVKAVDFVHPDPDTDRRGAHKRGDIILVRPDSHIWGTAEGPPKVVIVDVPDEWLTNADIHEDALRESRAQITPASVRKNPRMARLINRTKERKVLRRHRWSIDLDGANTLLDRRSE
jgi:hypothetical protein